MNHSPVPRNYLIVTITLAEDKTNMLQSQVARMPLEDAIETFCRRMAKFFLDKFEDLKATHGEEAKINSKISEFINKVEQSRFDEAYCLMIRDASGQAFKMCGVYLHGVGMFKKHFINVLKKGGRA